MVVYTPQLSALQAFDSCYDAAQARGEDEGPCLQLVSDFSGTVLVPVVLH